MKYFESVVNFVEKNFKWVIFTFLLAVVIEVIFFFIRSFKRKYYEYDNLYTTIISNIVAIIAIYVLACLIVGFVNCFKDQDWHFWTNYKTFLQSKVYMTLAIIALIIFGIIGFITGCAKGGIIVGILTSAIGSTLAVVILTLIGFIIYVIVAIIIIILKLIWFIISGFFTSLAFICSSHWLELVITIITPCAIYGMTLAFKSYLASFKENIIER